MYSGGYSAVVDLSKYFHNYPTHREDRPYLGLIHPITSILYAYYGLPMGSANSPATSGRGGNSFMRSLRERFAIFSGIGQANCYYSSFEGLGFDPKLGYGFILRTKDGLAVKLYGFVDDFLLNATRVNRRYLFARGRADGRRSQCKSLLQRVGKNFTARRKTRREKFYTAP